MWAGPHRYLAMADENVFKILVGELEIMEAVSAG